MVKQPVSGRVKTRLGRDIGMPAAAWWFRHQTRSLLRRLRDPRWHIVLAVSPDRAVGSSVWPASLERWPQGRGDLGARMARALSSVRGPVVLIGADIPSIETCHIAEAFQTLGRASSVIGPSGDGGYWLVGLRNGARRPPDLFQNVRWSVPDTLADTLPTLPQPVGFVAELEDVDTLDDLRRLKAG